MQALASQAAAAPRTAIAAAARCALPVQRTSERIAENLRALSAALAPQRRIVREGDIVYQAGERFENLYVLNSGSCKILTLAADGREQVVGLRFRGDWLGFDGIAAGRSACSAVAMDTGEVWVIPYHKLLAACGSEPALLHVLHAAMSREIAGDRDSLMSVCTLPADARVAEFLRGWAEAMAERGLRTDQITLRMSRAEIGNYLGMTLETVSRALSKLAREQIIAFHERGRRDIVIPEVDALAKFVQRCLSQSQARTLQ